MQMGDPEGNDLIDLAKEMRDKGVLLYILACEPDLGDDRARDVYQALCQITFGKFVGIRNKDIMDEVIIRAVQEEINTLKCQYLVEHEMEEKEREDMELVKQWIHHHLLKEKIVELDDVYDGRSTQNVDMIIDECHCIGDIKTKWKKIEQPTLKSSQNGEVELIKKSEDIDDEFVKKIMAKNKVIKAYQQSVMEKQKDIKSEDFDDGLKIYEHDE